MTGIARVWRPELYHGRPGKKCFFEGWYFKHVTRDEQDACSVIPGISLTADPADSHAFVQLLDRASGSRYYRYPRDEFRTDPERFNLQVGPNRFSRSGISLDIDQQGDRVTGTLSYGRSLPWPVRFLAPGYMGPFAFVPLMECYHAVLGFDHELTGELVLNGRAVNFAGGRGYVEKDWGSSMPEAWVWMQSNHFEPVGTSLSFSLARIPWLGRAFTGFGVGLLHRDRLYRFTSYTGARVTRLAATAHGVTVSLQDRRFVLDVTGTGGTGAVLASPKLGEMRGRVAESLAASIEIRLAHRRTGEVIFAGTGRNAGLEINGDIRGLSAGLGLSNTSVRD
jgi:tocopherol cyclase